MSLQQETFRNIDRGEESAESARLLVVDGGSGYGGALTDIIRLRQEFECVHCTDPARAIELAVHTDPALVLQAIRMPDADGLELVHGYREVDGLADVPIILFFTTEDEPAVKDVIFSAGADDYMNVLSGEKEVLCRLRYHVRVHSDRRALRDATVNLAELQKQIMRSEKMATIGQLAAGVAHEINNPVAFVSSNINSMADYYKDVFEVIHAYEQLEATFSQDLPELKPLRELKEQRQIAYLREDIEQIITECKEGLSRIRKIIEDLKNFSREGEVALKWTDINREIDSTLNIARNEIKYKADVVRNFDDLPEVECVTTQINQVILNLLVNAAQAIEEHGSITVTTTTETGEDGGPWVCIRIADTGCGIDAESLASVFEPFYTTKPVGKGTGLGLSLSNKIIHKHGGHIGVESEPGSGTTFSVWLPVQQADATGTETRTRT